MSRETAYYIMGCGIGLLTTPLLTWLMGADFSVSVSIAFGVTAAGYGFHQIIVS